MSEQTITGTFVSVHFPTFESCSPEQLNIAVFDNGKSFSTLPRPLIVIDDSFGARSMPQLPDPGNYDKLYVSMERAMANLRLISPVNQSRKPSRKYSFLSNNNHLSNELFFLPQPDPNLENDPNFQQLKEKINNIPSIF